LRLAGPRSRLFPTLIKGHGFHLGAGPHFLHALRNHPVARLQTSGDKPLVANRPVKAEQPLLNLASGIYDQAMGFPLGSRDTACWGIRMAGR